MAKKVEKDDWRKAQEGLKCLRCGGLMGEGRVVEIRRLLSTRSQEVFIEGRGPLSDERIAGGQQQPRPVLTFRCDRCGLLESYAP